MTTRTFDEKLEYLQKLLSTYSYHLLFLWNTCKVTKAPGKQIKISFKRETTNDFKTKIGSDFEAFTDRLYDQDEIDKVINKYKLKLRREFANRQENPRHIKEKIDREYQRQLSRYYEIKNNFVKNRLL